MDEESAPTGVSRASSPPPTLDGYEVYECVGVGGLGAVYRARQLSTGVEVAIKMVRSAGDDPSGWRRTERELRALAGLRGHAHVVGVIEVAPTENFRALVVDYAPGGSINDLITATGPLDIAEIVFVGRQVAHALESAHERGIVHRDIKPHNLLIDGFGQVRVCDFGVASLLGEEEFKDRTSGLSVRYASPEDVEDEPDVLGPPSDIYSLGATLLFLRRGAPPTTLERVAGWVPPTVVGDAAGAELDGIIAACLRLDPLERPTARVVHDRLHELEGQLGRPIAGLGLNDDAQRHDQPPTSSMAPLCFPPPDEPPASSPPVSAHNLDTTDGRQMRAEFRAATRPVTTTQTNEIADPLAAQESTAADEDFWSAAPPTLVRRPSIDPPTAWSKVALVAAAVSVVIIAIVMTVGRESGSGRADVEPSAATSAPFQGPADNSVDSSAASRSTAPPTAAVDIVERPEAIADLATMTWPLADRGVCMVQRSERAELVPVPCGQPHDLQSLGHKTVDDAGAELDDEAIRAVSVDVCARLSRGIATFDGSDSLTVEATVPSASRWADGDHVVQCWLRIADRRLIGDALS